MVPVGVSHRGGGGGLSSSNHQETTTTKSTTSSAGKGPSSNKWAGSIDMYRKIPVDLLEGTRRGSILSYIAVFVMLSLFLMETGAFFQKTLVTKLQLDINDEKKVRLNFNITMMDLKCEYCTVDVVSVLGTEQNITNHVTKWHVDAAGVRQRYQGRNKQQNDIDLFDNTVTETLSELYENGEDAISLSHETFQFALKEQEYVFVDFFASWCSHCRDLAPTWETLAEVMSAVAEHIVDQHDKDYSDEEFDAAKKVELPVMIAKVDCVVHAEFCQEQMIMAYPTLRLFVDGQRWQGGDYNGHRTVLDMADYLKQVEDLHKTETQKDNKVRNVEMAHKVAVGRLDEEQSDEEHEWAEKVRKHRQRLHNSWVDTDHPGCQLSGHLLLDRVPGNFHIQARSPHHDLVPHLTNVSHVIHHLSIGEPVAKKLLETGISRGISVPAGFVDKIAPMDGNVYVNHDLHEAYHHYLKVVTTNVEGLKIGRRELKSYQIIHNSQIAYYRADVVPEAKFIFDLSPIAVSYASRSRHWYDYVTSIMALIGGTFTAISILEASIAKAVSGRRRY